MLIRDWFFRIYGDVAHDWRFVTVMVVIMLLICWLSTEGLVSVARKTELWARRRWNRSAKRAARDARPLPEARRAPAIRGAAPTAGERYPEQLPAPGVADLRNTRAARRLLWAQITAALAAERNSEDA